MTRSRRPKDLIHVPNDLELLHKELKSDHVLYILRRVDLPE